MMNNQPTPKAVLITGGARGIGLACAQRFVQDGYTVVLVDRDRDALSEATKQLPSGPTLAIKADLVDPAAPKQLREAIARSGIGNVSVLVNNAGIAPKHQGRHKTVVELDREEWDTVFQVNLTAAAFMAKEFIPSMVSQGWGRIINISSITGRGVSLTAGAAYMASKSGLIGLTRHIAAQFGKHGITANVVAPGLVKTDMSAALHRSAWEQAVARIPTQRAAEPYEVASAVRYLASEEAGASNGAVLDVNGGAMMN